MGQYKLEGEVRIKVVVTADDLHVEDAEARLVIGLASARLEQELKEALVDMGINVEKIQTIVHVEEQRGVSDE